jgi:hypothetical protein
MRNSSSDTSWYNVVTYSADPTGSADSTTRIQNAINAAHAAGGGVVYFPPGTYKTSAALTLQSNTILLGDGPGVSVIKTSQTAVNGITGTSVVNCSMEKLGLTGPSGGSGIGFSVKGSGSSPVCYVTLNQVAIIDWGSHGVELSETIVSSLTNVLSQNNGGNGFNIQDTSGDPSTSLTFNSCYANGNGTFGYLITKSTYCSLNGCAADSNGYGYYVSGCSGIALNGCGAEFSSEAGFTADASVGCTLTSCYTYSNSGISFWNTDGAADTTMIGCAENSPAAGATYSVKTDTGTSGVVISPSIVTPASYSPGTVVLSGSSG